MPTGTRLDFTPAEGESLAAFLRYAVGPGQSQMALGYAPLPLNLVRLAHNRIARIPVA